MKTSERARRSAHSWGDVTIGPGEAKDIELAVSESYSSATVRIPIHVQRGPADGPTVFVTAALHGDEINGTGAIRRLIADPDFKLLRGTVILVPVLNLLAFERHSRYLPDRRDLNRAFPGSSSGSLASRMARTLFEEIVSRADYGIDLHTAALRRTNYPTVRADLTNPDVRRLAEAFGSEVVIDGEGPKGAFRREACLAGCPTIVMEGGEVWKVEPHIVAAAVTGVRNVLRSLDMLEGALERPPYQVHVKRSKWIRADFGGFLQFHVRPGELVDKDQPLATNTTLLGRPLSMVYAPFQGVVLGMVTLPSVTPGEPICNLGELPTGITGAALLRKRSRADGPDELISAALTTKITVVEPGEDPGEEPDA